MDVVVHYSTCIVGVLILGVYCAPVKWQDLFSFLSGVLSISVVLDCPGIQGANRLWPIIHGMLFSC